MHREGNRHTYILYPHPIPCFCFTFFYLQISAPQSVSLIYISLISNYHF